MSVWSPDDLEAGRGGARGHVAEEFLAAISVRAIDDRAPFDTRAHCDLHFEITNSERKARRRKSSRRKSPSCKSTSCKSPCCKCYKCPCCECHRRRPARSCARWLRRDAGRAECRYARHAERRGRVAEEHGPDRAGTGADRRDAAERRRRREADLPADREAVALQGRAERAGACDEPLSARPALAVAIPLSFARGRRFGGVGANRKSARAARALWAWVSPAQMSRTRAVSEIRAFSGCGLLAAVLPVPPNVFSALRPLLVPPSKKWERRISSSTKLTYHFCILAHDATEKQPLIL